MTMIQRIESFAGRFGARIRIDTSLIVEKGDRYFLVNQNLRKFIRKSFFYAGACLGKTKNGKFFPSFILLRMVAETKANEVIVDNKTEWLFICGRDIFRQGITRIVGSNKKGDYTLVLNQHGECLGFGRILRGLEEEKGRVAVKNISDIGDFLRREKQPR